MAGHEISTPMLDHTQVGNTGVVAVEAGASASTSTSVSAGGSSSFASTSRFNPSSSSSMYGRKTSSPTCSSPRAHGLAPAPSLVLNSQYQAQPERPTESSSPAIFQPLYQIASSSQTISHSLPMSYKPPNSHTLLVDAETGGSEARDGRRGSGSGSQQTGESWISIQSLNDIDPIISPAHGIVPPNQTLSMTGIGYPNEHLIWNNTVASGSGRIGNEIDNVWEGRNGGISDPLFIADRFEGGTWTSGIPSSRWSSSLRPDRLERDVAAATGSGYGSGSGSTFYDTPTYPNTQRLGSHGDEGALTLHERRSGQVVPLRTLSPSRGMSLTPPRMNGMIEGHHTNQQFANLTQQLVTNPAIPSRGLGGKGNLACGITDAQVRDGRPIYEAVKSRTLRSVSPTPVTSSSSTTSYYLESTFGLASSSRSTSNFSTVRPPIQTLEQHLGRGGHNRPVRSDAPSPIDQMMAVTATQENERVDWGDKDPTGKMAPAKVDVVEAEAHLMLPSNHYGKSMAYTNNERACKHPDQWDPVQQNVNRDLTTVPMVPMVPMVPTVLQPSKPRPNAVNQISFPLMRQESAGERDRFEATDALIALSVESRVIDRPRVLEEAQMGNGKIVMPSVEVAQAVEQLSGGDLASVPEHNTLESVTRETPRVSSPSRQPSFAVDGLSREDQYDNPDLEDEQEDEDDYETQRRKQIADNERLLNLLGLGGNSGRSLDDVQESKRGRPRGRGDSRPRHRKQRRLHYSPDGTTRDLPVAKGKQRIAFLDILLLKSRRRLDMFNYNNMPPVPEHPRDPTPTRSESPKVKPMTNGWGIGKYESYSEIPGDACHQCRRRSDLPKMKCRSKDPICGLAYCVNCVRVRYDFNFDEDNRTFICPKCGGYCNCSACLKRNGLINNFSNWSIADARKGSSVQAYLESMGAQPVIPPERQIHAVRFVKKTEDLTSPAIPPEVITRLKKTRHYAKRGPNKPKTHGAVAPEGAMPTPPINTKQTVGDDLPAIRKRRKSEKAAEMLEAFSNDSSTPPQNKKRKITTQPRESGQGPHKKGRGRPSKRQSSADSKIVAVAISERRRMVDSDGDSIPGMDEDEDEHHQQSLTVDAEAILRAYADDPSMDANYLRSHYGEGGACDAQHDIGYGNSDGTYGLSLPSAEMEGRYKSGNAHPAYMSRQQDSHGTEQHVYHQAARHWSTFSQTTAALEQAMQAWGD